ncbi:MAG: toll/interleukin-1 receptor domain-containing protein [Thermodesulfobacteriota bacterium]
MKASDRIKLIKGIAASLEKESWRLIDLTLKQFKLPWSNTWDANDKSGYVMEMVSEAADEALVDLAKHLGTITELGSTEAPSFWQPDQPRIFLSHLSKEKKDAGALKEALEEFGFACFVAHDDIEPTHEWQREIELALTTMDALVALLGPGFNESKWTDQEIGVAIGRKVPIVPLKNDLDPYGFIGKYQALQVKGKTADAVAIGIIELLAAKPQIASKISQALVTCLRGSSSWARSKRLMDLIEKCRQFSPDVIEELKTAVQENSQVSAAWGVPERIEKILEAHGA